MSKARISPFFQNRAIEAYSTKPSTPISLKHLINFGKTNTTGGKSETVKLLKGGNFIRTELPIRLSHRLRDLQNLPYIVASNSNIESIYQLYLDAFNKLRKYPELTNLQENDEFCIFMQAMLDSHSAVIQNLALGISESSVTTFDPVRLDSFMTRMLRSRIARRLIASQHIALSHQRNLREETGGTGEEKQVGVVDIALKPSEAVERVLKSLRHNKPHLKDVPVEIQGDISSTFAYIPEHLDFILYELISQACTSTLERHRTASVNHPVEVTIVQGQNTIFRVSDRGGGLKPWGGLPEPDNEKSLLLPQLTSERLDLFSFAHMRRIHQEKMGEESSLGLPVSDMYARYFSGSLSVHTMQGLGSDTYLTLPRYLVDLR